MLPSSLIAVSLAILLLAPGPALAGTATVSPATVSPGDSATYSYEVFTTYATPNGNISTTIMNQMTIKIDSINTTGAVGFAGYTQTTTVFNSTTLDPPPVNSSFTTIFDPYNNLTYYGQPWIGWYPFTYIDLSAGSKNLGVNVTVLNVPIGDVFGNTSYIEYVNATVAKSPGLIDVNFIAATGPLSDPNSTSSLTVMKFNSTTGWLESGVTVAQLFGVEKIFTYRLLSYTSAQPGPDYSWVAYVVLFAIAALLAYEFVTRRSRRKSKKPQIREKFLGKG